MARQRIATDEVRQLSRTAVEKALEAASKTDGAAELYVLAEMRNPSRSYFIRHQERCFSLKAVVTLALRERRPGAFATDFHATDGAVRLRDLGFSVVHDRNLALD